MRANSDSSGLVRQGARARQRRGDSANSRSLINRDLSDLAFVERVLEQAEYDGNPLLERIRFLAITGMLLDEFYRIRVAALREQIRMRDRSRGADGRKPSRQLRQADKYSNKLIRRQDRIWRHLVEELHGVGVHLVVAHRLRKEDIDWLARFFEEQIRPRLRPRTATQRADIDAVRDGELMLIAELTEHGSPDDIVEAVVPVPADLPRFIALPGEKFRYAPIEEVMKRFLDRVFGNATIVTSGLARILREGSLKIAEHGDDLLNQVRAAIEQREHADVIRLRVERRMPKHMLSSLAGRLGLLRQEEIKALERSRRKATASEYIVADAFLGLSSLFDLIDQLPESFTARHSFAQPSHREPEFMSQFDGDVFRAVAAADRLLHFPYDDFGVVVRLVEQAARDDAVTGIQQTLYRTGNNSPIVHALADAARRGKVVSVVVEIEARDDESRNIEFGSFLESAGVDVSWGVPDRKVHAKLLVISRRESGGIVRYVHCSTGNYNESAGRTYSDLCLFSVDEQLADESQRLLSSAHAGVEPQSMQILAIAPNGLRERIENLIEQEIVNAAAGKPAGIWLKLNKLSDESMIRLLYRASQAGVDIEIIVRGICCMRAGVPGLSERIRIRSVVGRFLEHSRVFCFGNGASLPSDNSIVCISSADLMPHKLDKRVEILLPIRDAALRRKIQNEVFVPYLRDAADTWILQPDNAWIRPSTCGYSVHQALFEPQEN